MSRNIKQALECVSFTGIAELFAKPNMPWWFVKVPDELCAPLEKYAERGLIAVAAAVGNTAWQTSLMPYGDGTRFIALPAKVRKSNNIQLGDNVTVKFSRRVREISG